jgi:hypothetical protein
MVSGEDWQRWQRPKSSSAASPTNATPGRERAERILEAGAQRHRAKLEGAFEDAAGEVYPIRFLARLRHQRRAQAKVAHPARQGPLKRGIRVPETSAAPPGRSGSSWSGDRLVPSVPGRTCVRRVVPCWCAIPATPTRGSARRVAVMWPSPPPGWWHVSLLGYRPRATEEPVRGEDVEHCRGVELPARRSAGGPG